MEKTIEILGGYAARIEDNKVILERKESEDEKIRKQLIGFFSGHYALCNINAKDTIAYLKKQKEQKSLNISAASEWLRKHISRYMNSEYNEFHKCVEYDGSIDKDRLINDFEEAMQKEQKPIKVYDNMDDLIADAMIDEISKSDMSDSAKHNRIYWINKHRQNLAEWSEEDKKNFEEAVSYIKDDSLKEFIKSLPERFNLQPKQEWKQENCKDLSEFECAMLHIGESFFGKNAGLNPNDTALVKEQAKLLIDLVESEPVVLDEKDEERLIKASISFLKHFADNGYENAVECIDWLKSKLDGNSC